MKALLIGLVLLVSGCTAHVPTIKYTGVPIYVKEDPTLLKPNERGQARMVFDGDKMISCTIILRKYPQCLMHEVRHCMEGNWHEGRESTQDC